MQTAAILKQLHVQSDNNNTALNVCKTWKRPGSSKKVRKMEDPSVVVSVHKTANTSKVKEDQRDGTDRQGTVAARGGRTQAYDVEDRQLGRHDRVAAVVLCAERHDDIHLECTCSVTRVHWEMIAQESYHTEPEAAERNEIVELVCSVHDKRKQNRKHVDAQQNLHVHVIYTKRMREKDRDLCDSPKFKVASFVKIAKVSISSHKQV